MSFRFPPCVRKEFRFNGKVGNGSANENVECTIRNMIASNGLIETKLLIWMKLVNGINAIEMMIIE